LQKRFDYKPAPLKSLGLTEKDVQVFAIPQPEIVAAFNRGDIDGGFVWLQAQPRS
jgi:taurine transport system substrate-binding protein